MQGYEQFEELLKVINEVRCGLVGFGERYSKYRNEFLGPCRGNGAFCEMRGVCGGGGGGGGKMENYETKKPKSTLLADNTQGLVTTKQTKPSPVASTALLSITHGGRGKTKKTRSLRGNKVMCVIVRASFRFEKGLNFSINPQTIDILPIFFDRSEARVIVS